MSGPSQGPTPPWDPGDPDSVRELAARLRTTADDVAWARKGMLGAHDATDWKGDSGDRFRAKLGSLPDRLQKVVDSYGAAADALTPYSYRLQDIQTAWWTAGSDRQALSDQFQAAVQDCRNAIDLAGSVGIQNDPWNTVQRFGGDAVQFGGDFVATAADLGKGIVRAFWDLPGEIADCGRDIANHDWNKLGTDFGKTVHDATIVLSIICLQPEVAMALEGVSIAVNLTQALLDYHDGKRLAAFGDLLAVIPGAGAARWVGRGEHTAEAALGDARQAADAAQQGVVQAEGALTASQAARAELGAAGRYASRFQPPGLLGKIPGLGFLWRPVERSGQIAQAGDTVAAATASLRQAQNLVLNKGITLLQSAGTLADVTATLERIHHLDSLIGASQGIGDAYRRGREPEPPRHSPV